MKLGTIWLLKVNWFLLIIFITSSSVFQYLSRYSFIYAACFPNQPMDHLQPSCSRIFGLTQGWTRRNSPKQISLCPTMLARHVICNKVVENGVRFLSLNLSSVFYLCLYYFLQVTYQTNTFLEKNRDYVVVEHCNLLSSSECPFIAGLFPSLPDESSRSSYKFSSVASRFKVFEPHKPMLILFNFTA